MSGGGAAESTPWLPVESNPEVFNSFAAKMGFPQTLVWQDVMSLEDWGLEMLPAPVRACAMVYEITPEQEAFKATEEAARAAAAAPAVLPFFMAQQIPNACGTIALIHTCVNLAVGGDVAVPEGSWLAGYIQKALPLSPVEREALLAADTTLAEQHADAVQQGQSAVVNDTWQHFVCFVEREGRLWELDGRKGGPIDHGPCAKDAVMAQAAGVIKEYMSRNPTSLNFTMLAKQGAPPTPPAQHPCKNAHPPTTPTPTFAPLQAGTGSPPSCRGLLESTQEQLTRTAWWRPGEERKKKEVKNYHFFFVALAPHTPSSHTLREPSLGGAWEGKE